MGIGSPTSHNSIPRIAMFLLFGVSSLAGCASCPATDERENDATHCVSPTLGPHVQNDEFLAKFRIAP
jgi:hypothetical protein